MDVIFVTDTFAPFGSGPAAESCASLAKALRSGGHKVSVVLPLLGSIDPSAHALARRLSKIDVQLGGKAASCELYDGRTSSGIELSFIGHEEWSKVHHLDEGNDGRLRAQRAGLFAAAAAKLLLERKADVVQAHGWVGALTVMHISASEAAGTPPIVLAVDDPQAQGRFSRELVGELGLDGAVMDKPGVVVDGELVVLAAGALDADHVTTTSTAATRELSSAASGALSEVFARLGPQLTGIAHGVDGSIWNPATDAAIASRYDPMDFRGKERCKAALQQATSLPVRDDVPLCCSIAHAGPSSGVDLLVRAVPDFMRNDAQLVVLLLEEDASLCSVLEEHGRRWPDRFHSVVEPTDALVHKAVAGADFLVVPCRSEPCGSMHRVAQRYGTVPVVRNLGDLADAVVDCDSQLTTGSGLMFDQATPAELVATLQRAIAAFMLDDPFESLRRRIMRLDCSWEKSARHYEALYRQLLKAAA